MQWAKSSASRARRRQDCLTCTWALLGPRHTRPFASSALNLLWCRHMWTGYRPYGELARKLLDSRREATQQVGSMQRGAPGPLMRSSAAGTGLCPPRLPPACLPVLCPPAILPALQRHSIVHRPVRPPVAGRGEEPAGAGAGLRPCRGRCPGNAHAGGQGRGGLGGRGGPERVRGGSRSAA